MVKKVLGLIFFVGLYFSSFANAPSTLLKGNHPDYKNSVLVVYGYADYITHTPIILGMDTVSASGDFCIALSIKETQQVYIDLGLFQGVLFVQPGDEFTVVLPDYSPKTMGEILNPFFQSTQIYLGIENIKPDNLNWLIADFDESYHDFIDKHYQRIFHDPKKREIDSVIDVMEAGFDTVNNAYFSDYRYYKYVWLRYMSYMRDYRYIVREYINNNPVEYNNVAYMDLFNQMFTNYFSFYMNTSEGERLYSDIAFGKSPKYIAETFENNMVLNNDTLQEFVMLKSIYDAYYSNDFPTASLTITLDSIAQLSLVKVHQEIAVNIKQKVFKAKAGQAAPSFTLEAANGAMVKNTDYLGDFVYLNFCSIDSYTCQQDFEMLKALYLKHKEDFTIVSISIDEDFERAKAYFEKQGYEWPLLSYQNQKNIIDDYKVRAYPCYYLINEEGNLKMSPAVGPAENFEWQFFKLLQSKKRGTND